MTTEKIALDRAVSAAGGISRLAERLSTTRGVVWAWTNRGKCPPEWCIRVEQAVEGAVTRWELRPDIFGAERQEAA